MPKAKLVLISHHLCPYVQRAVISLTEKGVAFERIDIDLANKPDWFTAISPLGKTPVLKVGECVIFESAVILEYLEDSQGHPLHPLNALKRATQRSWMEFGSSVLNDIAGFYIAPDYEGFQAKTDNLTKKFDLIEQHLGGGPWFGGADFSLIDVVYGPVFRYFDVFDEIDDFGILTDKPKLAAWRSHLTARPSIKGAVTHDYSARLRVFLEARNSFLSEIVKKTGSPLFGMRHS